MFAFCASGRGLGGSRAPVSRAIGARATVVVALAALCCVGLADERPRYTPPTLFDMKHIKLALDVDLQRKHVDGVATLSMTAVKPEPSVKLDAVGFDVKSVRGAMGGAEPMPLKFVNSGKEIEVFLPQSATPGQAISLEIVYAVHEPKDGLHFFQPSEDDPDVPFQMWSQGQATENRYWIPCFDHPGERQTTEVICTVDEKYQAMSNGKLVSRAPAGPGRTAYHWVQDKDHVIYLATLVVGDFHMKEETWQGVPVRYYVPHDEKDNVDHSFGKTTRMLEVFSEKIGVKYPWDQYAQLCCYHFGGGMENTSATTLGEGTVHDARTHLDRTADDLIAHELAHQWWGDLLTCREWAHLWLNEGFATWYEAFWTEVDLGVDEGAIDIYHKADSARDGGRDRPIVDRYYESSGQMFDSRAYPKGAWVLHMLRRRVGDGQFWKIMNHYCRKHMYGTVETSDFRRAIEEVTGTSWERFFFDWTERAGHPIVEISYRWNEQDRQAILEVKQTSAAVPDEKEQGEAYHRVDPAQPWKAYNAMPFHFPLAIEFFVEGEVQPVSTTRDITTEQTTIAVSLPRAPRMLCIDPEQAVLMELRENKGRDLWLAQLRDDPRVVGRVRAAKELAKAGKKTGEADCRAVAEAFAAERSPVGKRELARVLGEMEGEIVRDALLAGLSSPEARVRSACMASLRDLPRDAKIAAAARAIVEKDDPSYDTANAAAQALQMHDPDNALPALLRVLERPSERETLRSTALRSIARLDDPNALEVLLSWTAEERPAECREAALRGLGGYASRLAHHPGLGQRVLDLLVRNLETKRARLRRAAANGLAALGRNAEAALPALRRVAEGDRNEDVRGAARSAIEQIEKSDPPNEQLDSLRKQIEELRKELKERGAAAQKAG